MNLKELGDAEKMQVAGYIEKKNTVSRKY